MLVVSSDRFNRSRIRTVVVAAVTTSARAAAAPGNVPLVAGTAGLDRDCTVKRQPAAHVGPCRPGGAGGRAARQTIRRVDDGLRLVLSLG
jgi:mRNA interferase MazF